MGHGWIYEIENMSGMPPAELDAIGAIVREHMG